jgi:hypothetical protein
MVHPVMGAMVVAVDVGKNTAALSVTDAARHRLFGPVEATASRPRQPFAADQLSKSITGFGEGALHRSHPTDPIDR